MVFVSFLFNVNVADPFMAAQLSDGRCSPQQDSASFTLQKQPREQHDQHKKEPEMLT